MAIVGAAALGTLMLAGCEKKTVTTTSETQTTTEAPTPAPTPAMADTPVAPATTPSTP